MFIIFFVVKESGVVNVIFQKRGDGIIVKCVVNCKDCENNKVKCYKEI